MILTFLDLPLLLRHKIYALAGLVRPCPIHFVEGGIRKDLLRQLDPSWYRDDPEDWCWYPKRRRGLAERNNSADLECFCPALPAQLLYVSKGIHREVENVLYSQNRFTLLPERRQKAAALPNKVDIGLLQALSPQALAALRYLHIELGEYKTEQDAKVLPRFLKFYLLDPHYLISALELAGLEECAISFGCTREEALSQIGRFPDAACAASQIVEEHSNESHQLAKSTVLRLKDRPGSPHEPFAFTRLPAEIRARILFFTDLVPTHSDGFDICYGRQDRNTDECCTTCTPNLATCACWSRKPAYSTTCSCYAFPYPIFHVSRLMHTDATHTLFSYNRFIVGGDAKDSVRFFQSLNPLAARSIRNLDLKILGVQLCSWADPNGSESDQWYTLIQIIAEYCDLTRLHLCLDVGFMGVEGEMEFSDEDRPKRLREIYWELIKPMQRLRGLKRFHVFLSTLFEEEADMERSVMGEDYNAVKERKLHRAERGPWPFQLYEP